MADMLVIPLTEFKILVCFIFMILIAIIDRYLFSKNMINNAILCKRLYGILAGYLIILFLFGIKVILLKFIFNMIFYMCIFFIKYKKSYILFAIYSIFLTSVDLYNFIISELRIKIIRFYLDFHGLIS